MPHEAWKEDDTLALLRAAEIRGAAQRNGSHGPLKVATNIGATPLDASGNRATDAGSVITTCVADIEATPVCWLWPGRIPRGKLTIIAGNPGLGKSQITASIAAVVTSGGIWPLNGGSCTPGSALILSAEDDVSDTLRPRLEVAGADLSRTYFVEGVIRGYDGNARRQDRMFCLEQDLLALERKIKELGDIALLVIDPITAYLGKTDSHKNAEVRSLLTPLAQLAAQHNIAIVGVSHLHKASGAQAVLRIIGSVAFVAAARAAYLVMADPNDKERRLLLPVKNNLAQDTDGLAFRIEPATISSPLGPIETSRIAWDSVAVSTTADEALRASDRGEQGPSALDLAKNWIQTELANGSVAADEILKKAGCDGIARKTLERAKKALRVKAAKTSMAGGWFWSLPPKNANSDEDAQLSEMTALGAVGHLQEDAGETQKD